MKFASKRLGVALAVFGAAAVAGGGLAMAASAGPAPAAPHASSATLTSSRVSYGFSTLDNTADPTFNQLLGINDSGVIAGYFGSGAQGHPNKGYLLAAGAYTSENFPGSVQTQVTGLNNHGVTVGFWSDQNTANQMNDNFGWYYRDGLFHPVNFPTQNNASPPVNQLLGVNDSDVAVGFYTDAKGNNHGYEYRIGSGMFSRVTDPADPGASLTAAGINDRGDVAGFYTNAAGTTLAFLRSGDSFRSLAYPGASATQALGVSGSDEVVGVYTDGTGNSATMHGFTWTPRYGFTSVDDPHGVGATTINGVNDHGDLVGFYTDAAGNTHGLLAVPARPTVETVRLSPMPHGSVSLSWTGAGTLDATVNAFGFTPGSAHDVALVSPGGAIITRFAAIVANGAGQVSDEVVTSTDTAQIPVGSRVEITLAQADGAIASPAIAQTAPIASGVMSYQLRAVEIAADGTSFGTPQGWATIAYNPAAKTITVTLTASGLTPGMHAAHIHVGSCQSQGPVQYMLMDFVANGQGQVNHQVRTVTGVTSPIPSGAWYLNLHQGNSGNIVANGQPTVNFRPLLCSGI
jgi:Cu/Zn superoxide dismutase